MRSRVLEQFNSKAWLRFGLLPLLVCIAVLGLAARPLWLAFYPAVRNYCAMHFTELSTTRIMGEVTLALAVLSIAAMLVRLARVLLASRRLSESLAREQAPLPDSVRGAARRLGINIPLLYVQDEELLAFATGLRHPKIVVSSGLVTALSGNELEAVLSHEAAHATRRDPLKLALAGLARAGLFYLPIAWHLERRYALRLEVQADRTAVNKVALQPLAAALSKLVRMAPAGAAGIGDFIAERVQHLLDPTKRPPGPVLANRVGFASGVVAVVSVAGAWLLAGGINHILAASGPCNLPI